MGLRTRFPLFTGLIVLVSLWLLMVGLRSTGHITSIMGKAAASSEELAVGSKPMESLKQMEERLKERARQLDERERVLKHEEALMADGLLPEPRKLLISYAYTESETNRRNLQFFIQHGLFASAEFVFSFNGETDAHEMLPNHPNSPWYDKSVKNIEVILRHNKCYDFGAHGEALLREWDENGRLTEMTQDDRGGVKFWQKYSRFILMNASVRGPFLPYWSNECWAEAFLNKVTAKAKLVGMSYNCHGELGHVQSMVWATDRIGMEILMQKPPAGIGYWCPIDFTDAIYGETRTTPTFHEHGYEVDAMTAVYHSHDGDDLDGDGVKDLRPDGYLENCSDDDFFHENAYYGFNIHPYETIFMKAARKMNVLLLGNLTVWADGSGYSSYEVCDRD